jgi:ketosteroid isomerase-like protein
MSEDIRAMAKRLCDDIFGEQDEGIAALYAPQVVFRINIAPDVMEMSGADYYNLRHDEVGKLRKLDGYRMDVEGCFVHDTGFVLTTRLYGTTPDGIAIDLPACLLYEVRDGRITAIDEFVDSAQVAPLMSVLG